jgi:hypothetical protein
MSDIESTPAPAPKRPHTEEDAAAPPPALPPATAPTDDADAETKQNDARNKHAPDDGKPATLGTHAFPPLPVPAHLSSILTPLFRSAIEPLYKQALHAKRAIAKTEAQLHNANRILTSGQMDRWPRGIRCQPVSAPTPTPDKLLPLITEVNKARKALFEAAWGDTITSTTAHIDKLYKEYDTTINSIEEYITTLRDSNRDVKSALDGFDAKAYTRSIANAINSTVATEQLRHAVKASMERLRKDNERTEKAKATSATATTPPTRAELEKMVQDIVRQAKPATHKPRSRSPAARSRSSRSRSPATRRHDRITDKRPNITRRRPSPHRRQPSRRRSSSRTTRSSSTSSNKRKQHQRRNTTKRVDFRLVREERATPTHQHHRAKREGKPAQSNGGKLKQH